MLSVTVRRATPDDAVALAALARSTFIETWSELVPDSDRLAYAEETFTSEAFSRDVVAPNVHYLVLESSRTALVGYARLSYGEAPPPPLDFPAPAMLDRFYLEKSWHGTGAAQRLLESVFELARERAVANLWLCHHPSNLRAGRFYLRQGFQDTEILKPFTLAGRIYDDSVLVRQMTE